MKKSAVVTGASKGIGWALSKALLEHDFEVIGTSRSGVVPIEDEQLHALSLGLTNQQSIKNFADALKALDKPIDLLINNAGVGPDLRSPLPDEISFEQTFNVNVKGTVMLTESIIEMVKKGGMVINVSSKMGSVSHCERSGATAYRVKKCIEYVHQNFIQQIRRYLQNSFHTSWLGQNNHSTGQHRKCYINARRIRSKNDGFHSK